MMGRMPWWAWVWPLLAWGVLGAKFAGDAGGNLTASVGFDDGE